MLIGVSCVATLGGKEYQSANYLFHTTGKETRLTVDGLVIEPLVFHHPVAAKPAQNQRQI